MKNHLEMRLTPISELKVSPFAVRHHPREKRLKLAAILKKVGQVSPITIAGDYVVDGHLRLEAARDAGLTHVLTIDISHLPEADLRAVRLSLNRLAEGGVWDKKSLAREFDYLTALGYDLDLTGFDIVEIENTVKIGDDAPDLVEEIDASQVSSKPISKLGDRWILGEGKKAHSVLLADFRDEPKVSDFFGDRLAEICFFDPPYNVPIAGFVSGLGRVSHKDFSMASGEMPRPEFTSFLRTLFSISKARSSANALAYVCMDWRHIADVIHAAEAEGMELLNLAVWVKTNAGMGSFLRSQHELVPIFKRPGESYRNNVQLGKHGRSRSNVWPYRGVNVMGPERHLLAEHPTVKPSAMVADAIRDASKPGDIVFDAFLGSGTTLIAAERTGRICYGIEIEPAFVDLSIRRWQAETGKDAIRAQDGMSFDEAAKLARAEELASEGGQQS